LKLGHSPVEAVLDPAFIHQQPVENFGMGEVPYHHLAEDQIVVARIALGPQHPLDPGQWARRVLLIQRIEGCTLETFGPLQPP